MMKIKRWLKEIFDPVQFNNLDMAAIGGAFNDPSIRQLWLEYCFDELKAMNVEVDRRLLADANLSFTDLCARRKAFQDILEAVLSARRKLMQGIRPNPRNEVDINLDRVTA